MRKYYCYYILYLCFHLYSDLWPGSSWEFLFSFSISFSTSVRASHFGLFSSTSCRFTSVYIYKKINHIIPILFHIIIQTHRAGNNSQCNYRCTPDAHFCFSASAPTFSFFLLSLMRYTRLLAFTNMEVLESRNNQPATAIIHSQTQLVRIIQRTNL